MEVEICWDQFGAVKKSVLGQFVTLFFAWHAEYPAEHLSISEPENMSHDVPESHNIP